LRHTWPGAQAVVELELLDRNDAVKRHSCVGRLRTTRTALRHESVSTAARKVALESSVYADEKWPQVHDLNQFVSEHHNYFKR
jgi:hypothetical protein